MHIIKCLLLRFIVLVWVKWGEVSVRARGVHRYWPVWVVHSSGRGRRSQVCYRSWVSMLLHMLHNGSPNVCRYWPAWVVRSSGREEETKHVTEVGYRCSYICFITGLPDSEGAMEILRTTEWLAANGERTTDNNLTRKNNLSAYG